jgi:cysteine desulfurase
VLPSAYLDHAATTPLRAEAREAMMPWLAGREGRFGNPSGSHWAARAARQAIEEARDVVAEATGARPGEVVFTSGGTEAANLAVLGRVMAFPGPVVMSAVEHHCVLHAGREAERLGLGELRLVGVDHNGVVDLEAVEAALDPSVSVVSVQAVNNEVGTLQPLGAIARLVRRHAPQAVLHSDAVQAVPWYEVAELTEGADAVTISAHKFGGPQGIGALALRRPFELRPVLHGGPQERERRAGTHNVAGIAGMAAALLATAAERDKALERARGLCDELAHGLLSSVSGSQETAAGAERAPGHCHMVIEGIESEALLFLLDRSGVAASAGSACASGSMQPSHVLLAMGYTEAEAKGALRLTLGHSSTEAEVRLALEAIPEAVAHLRRNREGSRLAFSGAA